MKFQMTARLVYVNVSIPIRKIPLFITKVDIHRDTSCYMTFDSIVDTDTEYYFEEINVSNIPKVILFFMLRTKNMIKIHIKRLIVKDVDSLYLVQDSMVCLIEIEHYEFENVHQVAKSVRNDQATLVKGLECQDHIINNDFGGSIQRLFSANRNISEWMASSLPLYFKEDRQIARKTCFVNTRYIRVEYGNCTECEYAVFASIENLVIKINSDKGFLFDRLMVYDVKTLTIISNGPVEANFITSCFIENYTRNPNVNIMLQAENERVVDEVRIITRLPLPPRQNRRNVGNDGWEEDWIDPVPRGTVNAQELEDLNNKTLTELIDIDVADNERYAKSDPDHISTYAETLHMLYRLRDLVHSYKSSPNEEMRQKIVTKYLNNPNLGYGDFIESDKSW